MKKLLVPAILTTLFLSACTTERVVEVEKTTPTTEYVAPITTPSDPSTNFINGLSEDFPTEVSRLGKVETINLGRLTCDAIDEGNTLSDFVALAQKTGVDAGFMGALIREAVENFCPENQWFIDTALKA